MCKVDESVVNINICKYGRKLYDLRIYVYKLLSRKINRIIYVYSTIFSF